MSTAKKSKKTKWRLTARSRNRRPPRASVRVDALTGSLLVEGDRQRARWVLQSEPNLVYYECWLEDGALVVRSSCSLAVEPDCSNTLTVRTRSIS